MELNTHSENRRGKRVKRERALDSCKKIYDMDVVFERYCTVKLVEGRSPNTISKNRFVYKTFATYLDTQGHDHDVRVVNANMVNGRLC